jgi:hypothetical protein
VKLVLQCAMCGTQHPVGTPECTACRASGVMQMRLLFACPSCGGLGLDPRCGPCQPAPLPYEVVDDFVPVEVVYSLDPDEPAGGEFDVDLVAGGADGESDIFDATLADEDPDDADEVLIDEDPAGENPGAER